MKVSSFILLSIAAATALASHQSGQPQAESRNGLHDRDRLVQRGLPVVDSLTSRLGNAAKGTGNAPESTVMRKRLTNTPQGDSRIAKFSQLARPPRVTSRGLRWANVTGEESSVEKRGLPGLGGLSNLRNGVIPKGITGEESAVEKRSDDKHEHRD
ncbi:hypothetical protein BGW38_006724, partial [Lunasporangiospora selenospora]